MPAVWGTRHVVVDQEIEDRVSLREDRTNAELHCVVVGMGRFELPTPCSQSGPQPNGLTWANVRCRCSDTVLGFAEECAIAHRCVVLVARMWRET